MGLRFRKSINLCKGLKLNIGKTGFSISAGIPGFRKTIHSSGKVTTSIGIPGTGIYYVDTKNPKEKDSIPKTTRNQSTAYTWTPAPKTAVRPDPQPVEYSTYARPVASHSQAAMHQHVYDGHDTHVTNRTTMSNSSATAIPALPATKPVGEIIHPIPEVKFPSTMVTGLFEQCDYPVKWIDVLTSALPQDSEYNPETWQFLRSKAIAVFEGDVEAMMEIIERINPYDDLLDYLTDFEVEADDAECIEVTSRLLKNSYEGNMEDAAASLIIRLARDTFALLPVSAVRIRMENAPETIISDVYFERDLFADAIFENQDASDLLTSLCRVRDVTP